VCRGSIYSTISATRVELYGDAHARLTRLSNAFFTLATSAQNELGDVGDVPAHRELAKGPK
jgi:hypothetical protein